MENKVEHDWEYIGYHFVNIEQYVGTYERYEFKCKKCGISALCKGKKLKFLEVDLYKIPSTWEQGRISFVFGDGRNIPISSKIFNGYFVGTPIRSLEPDCISEDDWDVFDMLI